MILSPLVQIPIELEKLFFVLEHALPDRKQPQRIASELSCDHPEELRKARTYSESSIPPRT